MYIRDSRIYIKSESDYLRVKNTLGYNRGLPLSPGRLWKWGDYEKSTLILLQNVTLPRDQTFSPSPFLGLFTQSQTPYSVKEYPNMPPSNRR